MCFLKACAVITHLNLEGLLHQEADTARLGVRMTEHVGHGFLHNAVSRNLHGGRKRGQMFGSFHCHRKYSIVPLCFGTEPSNILANGTNESEFIERRWAQVVDDAPDIANDRLDLGFKLVQEYIGGLWIALVEGTHQADFEHDRAEHWPQAVVQVAT